MLSTDVFGLQRIDHHQIVKLSPDGKYVCDCQVIELTRSALINHLQVAKLSHD